MSEGHLTPFDRYEVGKKLGLDKEETDDIVEQLEATGRIVTAIGTKIVLSPRAKDMLDSEKGIA
ncbi:MAG: hypothetical protein ACRD97_03265 [Nitrososphaeraceae archaeon]